MAVKTEKELSEQARSLWLKAVSAMEMRNFGYTISLIQAVLKETPDFLDGRRALRRAEVAQTKGKKSFFSGLSTAALKGGAIVKKDPLAAMELAEKSLETDPYSVQANRLLKDAAMAAGFPEIAGLALETLAEGHPKDTKILHDLGEFYYEHGDPAKAVDVYSKIVELNPSDLIAIKKGKDAAAKSSMATGGWTEATSYRDVLKDKETAISLEQQSRVVRSEDMIDQQIVELYERAEKEPENVDVARKIASLYEDKGEIQNALWWYQKAAELTHQSDPGINRRISDLKLKNLDLLIAERARFLSESPDHEMAAQFNAELEDLRKQKAEMLIGEARKRVERNPTDLQFRYELGEQLVEAGHYTEAIPELQQARRNPNARLKAMNLLGQCYLNKGMLDLAAKQFTDAASEIIAMDAMKKEIVYNLGLVYEKMGEAEKSLDCMKQIYEVDYGYNDVAKRVEASYQKS
jgi:tetratricopeptide (TPR) repeat protein